MACKHVNSCGFYRKFQGRESLVWKGMIKNYCDNGDECALRVMFDAGQTPPSDDIMPVGTHASQAFLSLP